MIPFIKNSIKVFTIEFFIGVLIYGVVVHFLMVSVKRLESIESRYILYVVTCVLLWLTLDICKLVANHKIDSYE